MCYQGNFLKKLLWDEVFLDRFNGLLIYETKGSRSRLYDGIRSQTLSHRSRFFVFKLASFVLSRILTYIGKFKTITVDESIKFLHGLILVVLDGFRLFQIILGRFGTMAPRGHVFQSNFFTSTADIFYFNVFFHFNFFLLSTFLFTSNFFDFQFLF